MTVTKFKKGEETYTLVFVDVDGGYWIIYDVVDHKDIADAEYFPQVLVYTSGRSYPRVFNWNEFKMYWQPDDDELSNIKLEIEASKTGWHEGLEDDAPN